MANSRILSSISMYFFMVIGFAVQKKAAHPKAGCKQDSIRLYSPN
jgi:hypothetical protein